MRLFIAAELPKEILEALAENSALLRSCVRGRFVTPNSFHVTLAFMGNVPDRQVDDVCAALDRACTDVSPFKVSLGDFGCFGKHSKATLWQGFRDAGALPTLADSVRHELHTAGFPFDSKTFKPHITLMRAADLSAGELPMPAQAKGDVENVTLFQSDLSGKRPVYTALHTVAL